MRVALLSACLLIACVPCGQPAVASGQPLKS